MGDISDLIAQGVRPPVVDDPTQTYAKQLTLQGLMQQRQIGQLQLQGEQMKNAQMQYGIDQQKAVNAAYQSALTVGADGAPDIDSGKISTALAQNGHGSAIPEILKNIQGVKKGAADLAEQQGKVQQQQLDFAGTLGATAKSANYDPQLFLTTATHAVQAKAVDAGVVSPLIQHVQAALQQDPSGASARTLVQQISDQFLSASAKQRELAAADETADAHRVTADADKEKADADTPGIKARSQMAQRESAASVLAGATSAADYQQKLATLDPAIAASAPPASGWDAKKTPAAVLQWGMQPDQVVSTQQTAIRDANAAKNEAARTAIAQGELRLAGQREAFNEKQFGGSLDQNTLEMMANAVHSGVPMSQVVRGQGKQATAQATQILGYIANNIDPKFNVGRALADFAGQKSSVEELTKQFQSTSALEKIAGANIDSALAAMAKIPDTGKPLLNTPIRLLNEKMLGSGDQAQAMTQLLSAARESARVVNNFGGKGELTDSARAGVDALMNNRDITLNQFMGVARGMKQDFQNVHNGMYSGLQDARNAIGADNGPRTGSGQGGAITVKDPKGGSHVFTNQADAAAFKKAAGIQ